MAFISIQIYESEIYERRFAEVEARIDLIDGFAFYGPSKLCWLFKDIIYFQSIIVFFRDNNGLEIQNIATGRKKWIYPFSRILPPCK